MGKYFWESPEDDGCWINSDFDKVEDPEADLGDRYEVDDDGNYSLSD